MSKITKAIERAKKSRKASVREVDELRLREQTPAMTSSLIYQQSVYSQTRVVSLDDRQLERNRLLTLLDDPVAIDCYNVLCTQILERTRAKGQNTIMITSCADGEGKSVTAINLAVTVARRVQHTVLLVDADLRKPDIHRLLGLNNQKGLSDYLRNDEPILNLLINPGLPRMVVLPAGKSLRDSTERLSSPKMEALVREMKGRYPERYVIFDCPPLLNIPDSLALSSYMDGIVLVVEGSRTSREQIQEATKLLNGKPLLGLVMNKFKSPRKGYYHYYGR